MNTERSRRINRAEIRLSESIDAEILFYNNDCLLLLVGVKSWFYRLNDLITIGILSIQGKCLANLVGRTKNTFNEGKTYAKGLLLTLIQELLVVHFRHPR